MSPQQLTLPLVHATETPCGEGPSEKHSSHFDVPIRKIDDSQRLVFGWCSIVEKADGEAIVDHHGHVIFVTDLEKAVYQYMEESRVGGDMHSTYAGELVESLMVTAEKLEAMGLASDALPKGWWVGYRIKNDDTWTKVLDGTYQMFSIGAYGTLVDHE
jgi:hypothetical protein